MRAKDLKAQLFGDFVAWLDKKGLGDPFSMDVWMSQAFDRIHKMYLDDRANQKTVAEFESQIPTGRLRELLIKREAENAAKAPQQSAGCPETPAEGMVVAPECCGRPMAAVNNAAEELIGFRCMKCGKHEDYPKA